eukprot:TRINITY_DN3843_c0_g1_i1.p1 TRINITY_DN3843_c0_g1~~TRINITY_DN3843_c0_g1_i1.p1  ORF type:complete len:409 (-),score=61.45 TRINITY_DN3843_c0_g1_i1:101-1327(-)
MQSQCAVRTVAMEPCGQQASDWSGPGLQVSPRDLVDVRYAATHDMQQAPLAPPPRPQTKHPSAKSDGGAGKGDNDVELLRAAAGRDKAERGEEVLGFVHRLLAQQLAQLDVRLADELVLHADSLRVERLMRRIEGRRWMQTSLCAVRIVTGCRQQREPKDAELLVRRRIKKLGENALHRYGGLLHVALYPFTILLAIFAYTKIAISMTSKVRVRRACTDGKLNSVLISSACKLLFLVCMFAFVLPLAVVAVALSAVPDILLLLARPVLPLKTKKTLPWFLPTSLAFWGAGAGGYMPALLSHSLLGACPVDDAFVNLSSGGELYNSRTKTQPPSMAFRAAVVCNPHFLGHLPAMRATALRGIPEFFAPAGGPLACMPEVVQWAYLLGDMELMSAWEAETMGELRGDVGV